MAIEVDGNIHVEKSVAQYDKDRQEYLESQELNFLRFTNDQVENELTLVIERIEKYIVDHRHQNNKDTK